VQSGNTIEGQEIETSIGPCFILYARLLSIKDVGSIRFTREIGELDLPHCELHNDGCKITEIPDKKKFKIAFKSHRFLVEFCKLNHVLPWEG
jgi:hypothetical protein